MSEETQSWWDKATIVGFATLVCIFLFIVLTASGLIILIFRSEAFDGWKEIYIIVMPTITSIFTAFEIIKRVE